jgi:drug/metabolite transporter (DMT)-like permease
MNRVNRQVRVSCDTFGRIPEECPAAPDGNPGPPGAVERRQALPVGNFSTGLRSRPVLQAALGAISISASAVLIPLAHVSPTTAAFYRCVLPLPVLGMLAAAEQRRHGPRRIASRARAVLAGMFLAVNLVLWIHSIADVGAGVATVLGNLQVLFVVALAWLALHERPARRYLVALPVVLAGVVLASGLAGGGSTAPHPAAGVACGLAASATYACFLLLLRQTAGEGRHPVGQLFDATSGAAVGALLLGLGGAGGLQLGMPWRSLGWLLVLAVSSGIVGWLLITSSLPQLPADLSALLLLLEPAAAIVLAYLVLGQRPSLIQVAGAALVCGGVLAAARSPRRSRGNAVGWHQDPATSSTRLPARTGASDCTVSCRAP